MASDLTVSGLVAASGVRSVVLSWVNGPDSCLVYLAWKGVEVWAAEGNDRATAIPVGTAEGRANLFTHADLDAGSRWYWIRAVDINGDVGPWHPAGSSDGIEGAATDALPGPGSITEAMLADGAVSRRTFVPGLTPVEIGPAFPVTENYVGRMFFRTTDNLLYRFDGTGFVATLPTAQLTGQITAGQLAANAVSANAIQAGAVTAGKISVANLAAISANLGTITAGTIYGAYIATANATSRVELNGAANQLAAYRDGAKVVTIAGGLVGAGTPAYVHVLDTAPSATLIAGVNYGAGVGVYGQANGGIGVLAYGGPNGTGVEGSATGNGIGVEGSTTTGAGVYGTAGSTGDGVAGVSNAGAGGRFTGIAGVLGNVTNSANIAVRADLNNVPGAGKMQAAAYVNFTGVHEELIDRAEAPVPGDILVDTGVVFRRDIVNATSVVSLSSRACQRGAVGVFVERHRLGVVVPPALMSQSRRRRKAARPSLAGACRPLRKIYDVASVAAVGEGMINVCGEGGDIEVGDLIVASSLPGKGMRQADDIVRSCTVARAREPARFSRPHKIKTIACIYHAG